MCPQDFDDLLGMRRCDVLSDLLCCPAWRTREKRLLTKTQLPARLRRSWGGARVVQEGSEEDGVLALGRQVDGL
jgi:hypothetical protein